MAPLTDRRGLLQALVKDGRPLIVLTALALLFSGGFALFLSAVRQFLPHDLAFLGLSAAELCALGECRVVSFMVHDRATFGGVLIAIGTLYLWLAEFPLRRGAAWAWWTLRCSCCRSSPRGSRARAGGCVGRAAGKRFSCRA